MTGPILDIGCGSKKTPGAVGLDLAAHPQVDVIADAGKPLPFAASSFARIRLSHIVEHVPSVIDLMAEVHRIALSGALVEVLTPHFSAAGSYTDPTHCRHLGYFSLDYFCGLAGDDFPPLGFAFAMLGRRIIFGRLGRLGLAAWANRHPRAYEQHLAWRLPALEVRYRLAAHK